MFFSKRVKENWDEIALSSRSNSVSTFVVWRLVAMKFVSNFLFIYLDRKYETSLLVRIIYYDSCESKEVKIFTTEGILNFMLTKILIFKIWLEISKWSISSKIRRIK